MSFEGRHHTFLILSLLLGLQGCLEGPSELVFKAPGANIRDSVQEERVTFCDLKKKVLLNNCLSCHRKMDSEDGLASYLIAGKPEQSPLFLSVENGSMPINRPVLTGEQLDLVKRYIRDLRPADQIVSFDTLKKEVLIPHCLKCHGNMGEEINISQWINSSDPSESPFLITVERGEMPMGKDPLEENLKEIIRSYLKQRKLSKELCK